MRWLTLAFVVADMLSLAIAIGYLMPVELFDLREENAALRDQIRVEEGARKLFSQMATSCYEELGKKK